MFHFVTNFRPSNTGEENGTWNNGKSEKYYLAHPNPWAIVVGGGLLGASTRESIVGRFVFQKLAERAPGFHPPCGEASSSDLGR